MPGITPTTLIGGAPVEEIVQGYDEGIDVAGGGPFSNKSYLCYWTDRYTIANAMCGFVGQIPISNGPIIFPLSMRHPESPNIIVQQVSIEGKGVPFQGAKQLAFPYAIIRATFGRPTWSGLDVGAENPQNFDPGNPIVFATQELDYGYELFDMPGRGVKYADNGLKISGDNAKYIFRMPYAVYSLTLHYFPYMVGYQYITEVGSLNQTTYLGVPPRFLRFDGGKYHWQTFTNGQKVADLALKFSVRTLAHWDDVWNPDTQEFTQVLQLGGTPMVPQFDFTGQGNGLPLIPQSYFQQFPY